MKTNNQDKQTAKTWNCDERTARRWAKAGAPLQDTKAMRAWLSTRRTVPPGTADVLNRKRQRKDITARILKHFEPAPTKRGAAFTLSRLEGAEANAHDEFQRALKAGDAVLIRACRDTWLEISEQLRKVNLGVEESRRLTGDDEAVPRKKVVETLEALSFWINYAFQELEREFFGRQQLGLRLPDVAQTLQRAWIASITSASRGNSSGCWAPDWMIEAITKCHFGTEGPKEVKRWGEALKTFMGLVNAEYDAACVEKRVKALRHEAEWLRRLQWVQAHGCNWTNVPQDVNIPWDPPAEVAK